jgi:proline dehydrogenase
MSILSHSDFEDTKTAFSYKNDKELKKARLLFKAMGNKTLVQIGSVATLYALRFKLPIDKILRLTVYDHFCGGDSLSEVKTVVQKFESYGINMILNYGVEGKYSEEDFDKTAEALNTTLDYAIQNKNINTISCKPSGLISHELLEKLTAKENLSNSEQIAYTRGIGRIRKLIEKAFLNRINVHLDAEETWIQGAIDEIAFELSTEFNKDFPTVINGVQLYLKSKLAFLQESLEHSKRHNYICAVKLVRGAYMDKERNRAELMNYPSPVWETKEKTDKNYNEGLKYCIDNIDKIHLSNATHNEDSCIYLAQLMNERNLPNNHHNIVSSQLKGMSDNISFAMAKLGYNVQKYLPYGPVNQVIPYLIRRAQENTSVDGQTGRELELISKEIKRRGLGK